jgi:hypothetical protein
MNDNKSFTWLLENSPIISEPEIVPSQRRTCGCPIDPGCSMGITVNSSGQIVINADFNGDGLEDIISLEMSWLIAEAIMERQKIK